MYVRHFVAGVKHNKIISRMSNFIEEVNKLTGSVTKSDTLSAQLHSAVASLKTLFKKGQLDLLVNTETVESIFPPQHRVEERLKASTAAAAKMLEAARERKDGTFERVATAVGECNQVLHDTPTHANLETKRALLLNSRALVRAEKQASIQIIDFVKLPFLFDVTTDSDGWGRWEARHRSDPTRAEECKHAPLANLFITGVPVLDEQYLVMPWVV